MGSEKCGGGLGLVSRLPDSLQMNLERGASGIGSPGVSHPRTPVLPRLAPDPMTWGSFWEERSRQQRLGPNSTILSELPLILSAHPLPAAPSGPAVTVPTTTQLKPQSAPFVFQLHSLCLKRKTKT